MTVIEESGGQYALATCAEQCEHPGWMIERDRYGRPVIEGQARTRVSTLAGTLDDSHGLIDWKARTTLLGATPTLLRSAKSARGDTKALNALAEEAVQRAGGGDAASEGTMMHEHMTRYAMDADAFDWDAVDDKQAETVVAFGDVLRQAGMSAFMAEQFVLAPKWAGTFDLGLRDETGLPWLADIKTGAKMWDRKKPIKVATQLAAYASARRWCPVNGYLPTPDWAGLLLISAPLDTGDVYLDMIDMSEATSALHLALTVRAKRTSKGWLRPFPIEREK